MPPEAPPATIVACDVHRRLARRVAARGMVLLKNEPFGARPVLPLDAVRRVAVIGTLADAANHGDQGSSAVRPPGTVTMLAGLRSALGDDVIDAHDGRDVDAAVVAARSADVAILVVGYTAADEGEALMSMDRDTIGLLPGLLGSRRLSGATSRLLSLAVRRRGAAGGDRRHLALRPADEALIGAVAAVNPRTIVVIVAGSAVLTESWRERVTAILLAWYPGMEGGHALADVLTGAVEPGGRLPFAIPTDEDHLPHFDRHARTITYDRWWGQRRLDRDLRPAAFPVGFGLGYTTFELPNLTVLDVDVAALTARVEVGVRNIGERPGDTVVQLYAAGDAGPQRPRRQLVGFARVGAGPGETASVVIDATLRPLARRNPTTRRWSLVPAEYQLEAGRFWGDPGAAIAPLPRS